MTTPGVVPSQYAGDYTDYLRAPSDKGGAARLISDAVTVPDATTAGTNVGLVPFRKGMRLCYGSALYAADLDTATNVVIDIGYIYKDNDTTTNINDEDAFVDGSTAGQAGGMISLADDGALAGLNFEALADGWIVAQIQAGPTTTEGALTYNLLIGYSG